MKTLYERISLYLTKTGHEALGESVGQGHQTCEGR